LMDMTDLYDLNICGNRLYTPNSDLRDFLNNLQPDWEKCQKKPLPGTLLLLLGESSG
jgi:hypothetical protein